MGTWVDFQAVKQAVTLGQVLERYGIKLKRTGKELHGRCPIHQGKGEPLLKEISKGSAVFFTSPVVVGSPGHLERDIGKSRSLLHDARIERARRCMKPPE